MAAPKFSTFHDAAKFSTFYNGFLAFRNGNALCDIHRAIKVFRTEEAARKALAKSKAFWGW